MKKCRNLLLAFLMLVTALCVCLAVACKKDKGDEKVDERLDPAAAVMSGVMSLANEASTFDIDLGVNDNSAQGVIYLDLGGLDIDEMDIRAQIGSINVYVNGGKAYLSAGDLKLAVGIQDVVSLVTGIVGGGNAQNAVATAVDAVQTAADDDETILDKLAEQLSSGGKFTEVSMRNRTAHGEYPISLQLNEKTTLDIDLAADFSFMFNDGTEMYDYSINALDVSLELADMPLSLTLTRTDDPVAELTGKESFIDLSTYVATVKNIITGDVLHGDVSYASGNGKIAVDGDVDVNIANTSDISAQATVKVTYSGKYATVKLAYKGGKVYLDFVDAEDLGDGSFKDVKIEANVTEAYNLIKGFLSKKSDGATDGDSQAGNTVAKIVDAVLFSTALTDNIAVTQTGGELGVAVKTAALLKAFGFDLGIKDINVTLDDKSIGAELYGVSLTVTSGKTFAVDTEGYQKGINEIITAFAQSLTHEESSETETARVLNKNFYIDGQISAHVGFTIIDIKIKASISLDDNNKLKDINIHMEVDGNDAMGMGKDYLFIAGDTATDITVKNGMLYMKRVQTTAYSSSTYSFNDCDPVTVYRVTPLKNFTGDLIANLSYILNFGDYVLKMLPSGGSLGGESTSAPAEPIAATKSAVVTSYAYTAPTEEDKTQSWELGINGNFFTELINYEKPTIKLKLTSDDKGLIGKLEIPSINIVVSSGSTSLGISASANFNWNNPGGIMKEGVTDTTADVSKETVFTDSKAGVTAMIDKLTAEKWASQKAIEAKQITVNYKLNRLDGNTDDLDGASQQVYVSTGMDGSDENTLYTLLSYPDLEEPTVEKYAEWNKVDIGEVLGDDNTVYAEEHKQQYQVKFVSDILIDGWETEDGKYVKTYSLEYGTTITVNGSGVDSVTQTVDQNLTTYTLPASSSFGNNTGWTVRYKVSSIVFTGFYSDKNTVTYHSAIGFTMDGYMHEESFKEQFTDGETYTLNTTPTANGYIFIGWYEQTGDSWTEVTEITDDGKIVEALWAKTVDSALDVTIDSAVRSNMSYSTGKIYDYTITASINSDFKAGIEFFGAVADYAKSNLLTADNVDVKFEFTSCNKSDIDIDRQDLETQDFGTYTSTATYTSTEKKGRRDNAAVIVTVTYTINGVTLIMSDMDMSSWETGKNA